MKFIEKFIYIYSINYQISFIKFSMKYVLVVHLFEIVDVCIFFS